MTEGDVSLVDGAVLVSPRSPAEALRSYPRAVETGGGGFKEPDEILRAENRARASAEDLANVENLSALGLPPGSEPGWLSASAFWEAAVLAAWGLLDPGYIAEGPATGYTVAARPKAVRDAIQAMTPSGKLAVPTILLQGALDIVALPVWAEAYEGRVLEAGRELGLRLRLSRSRPRAAGGGRSRDSSGGTAAAELGDHGGMSGGGSRQG
jgi:hypothetical protein